MMEEAPSRKCTPQKHFILVHGACHGAWCWYKLKPMLEGAGHKVTALDLSASGVHPKKIEEIQSFYDYTLPLLDLVDSLPPDEKVILVGHSLGGLSLALAIDHYPHKVSAAVFLTAFMPDTAHAPSYVLQQFYESTPAEAWLDTQFYPSPGQHPLTIILFGPKVMSTKFYQLSPAKDLALGKMLIRPSSLFIKDLSRANKLSEERYGSVKRVYVVCEQDKIIPKEFQRWQIENVGVTQVMEIKEADHMAMFSSPQQLFHSLLDVADKYD